MAEWLKAADCKSALFGVRRFESYSAHIFYLATRVFVCGSSSVGRATAFQAVGREFEPRLPLHNRFLKLLFVVFFI